MLLGDYYDEVMKEAGLSKEAAPSDDSVELAKQAEAVESLKAQGVSFDTEEQASEAVKKLIEDDYAEKVAAVCSELDSDKVEFETNEQKVAAAMEIIDGWEKLVVTKSE